MNWYLKVLKQYADFSGRARRKEYWMFVLFNVIFAFVAIGIDYMISGRPGFVYAIYILAILIPSLAVAVRRLHDVGKSGWMYLIVFIPIIGAFWLLYLFVLDSNQGDNQYGPNPKDGPEDYFE